MPLTRCHRPALRLAFLRPVRECATSSRAAGRSSRGVRSGALGAALSLSLLRRALLFLPLSRPATGLPPPLSLIAQANSLLLDTIHSPRRRAAEARPKA